MTMVVDEWGRTEPPATGDPFAIVSGFHRFLRETLIFKTSGLSPEQVRWSPVESGTCLLALMKHSINVERYWISDYIAGQSVSFDWTEENPNAEWILADSDSSESLISEWRAEADRTDTVLRSLIASDWDRVPETPAAAKRGFSIGWVVTHMVEEVGRHCGHADLIREMIDGSVGE